MEKEGREGVEEDKEGKKKEAYPIPNPSATSHVEGWINSGYTKLHIWNFVEYSKIVYIDADALVLEGVDELFDRPSPSAAPDTFPPDKFNAGVLVVCPCKKTFDDMLSKASLLKSYDTGDTGFLNAYFQKIGRDWYKMPTGHRLPFGYNALRTMFWLTAPRTRGYWDAVRPLKIIHYCSSPKPWEDTKKRGELEMKWWEFYTKSVSKHFNEERDPQIWPIAGTMLIAGSAVGVILPVMPLLVKELGISQAQFGIIVAAFGFSKLLANIPAATLTDRIGRRPVMVGGLGLISMGMIGFGMAETFSHLAVARLMTGVGVSALIAGATMSVTDISTQINRARMIAPMTAAFSAGAIVGPGVGGLLASSQGTHVTFYCVGGIFALNAVYTQIFIQETSPYHLDQARTTASKTGSPPAPKISQEGRQSRSMLDDIREWGPIWQDSKIRTLMFLNMSYWAATAGANMTLLPLMLASEKFNLEPAMIGAAFAIQSAVSVAGAVPVASLADRIGPNKIIAPGMAITGVAMASFPFTETVPTAFCVLAFWALGSTMLGSAPTAYAANLSTEKNRTQVLALLRTMGDVGLLVGSSSVGITAGMVGNDLAMQGTASFVALSTAWFLIRQRGGSAKAAGGH
eukprot:g798.t1